MSCQMTMTSLLASWLPQRLQLGLSSAAMQRAKATMAATMQRLQQLGSPGGPKRLKRARKQVPKAGGRVAAAARTEAARAHGQHASVLGCAGAVFRTLVVSDSNQLQLSTALYSETFARLQEQPSA